MTKRLAPAEKAYRARQRSAWRAVRRAPVLVAWAKTAMAGLEARLRAADAWAVKTRLQARKRPPKGSRPRCGAKTKSGPCQAPAAWRVGDSKPVNGRCIRHGGRGPGERKFSPEALAACRDATRRATEARRAAKRG